MTVDDLAELELAYAPPFGSAKDPVNMAGFMAQNVLDGTLRTWGPDDLDGFGDDVTASSTSVRQVEVEGGHLRGSYNVPHTELRERLDEVASRGRRPTRAGAVRERLPVLPRAPGAGPERLRLREPGRRAA